MFDLTSLTSAGDAGGFDLSSLTGGGSSNAFSSVTGALGAGGFDINKFTDKAVKDSGFGGIMSLAGSGAALGGTLGTVFPGVGNAIGAVIGGAGGIAVGLYNKFLGGSPRVPFGAEANDAAPHRGPAGSPDYLDMSNYAQDNGNEFARWAIENNCTVEDLAGAINYDHQFNPNTWEQTVAWWRTHPDSLKECLAGHFKQNPQLKGAPQYTSAALSAPAAASTLTGATYALGGGSNSFVGGGAQPLGGSPANAAAASAAGMSLQDYLKAIANGILNGAGKGAGDAISATPAGQQIKKDTINDYIRTYQLPLAGAGLGLVWLIYKALNK